MEARPLADGVHVMERPLRFFGVEMGTRMTVLQTERGLLVHSPIDVSPDQLSSLGEVRWVLAPNLFHHLFVGAWAEAGIETWCAQGLDIKRPDVGFHGVVTPGMESPFGSDIEVYALRCFPMVNEVLVLHRPSRTLLVTDLVFNFPQTAPAFTRGVMWGLGGYPGCRSTLLERLGMKRALARKDLEVISRWDFDRLIMAHGEVIETGGKEAFFNAYRWLMNQN